MNPVEIPTTPLWNAWSGLDQWRAEQPESILDFAVYLLHRLRLSYKRMSEDCLKAQLFNLRKFF